MKNIQQEEMEAEPLRFVDGRIVPTGWSDYVRFRRGDSTPIRTVNGTVEPDREHVRRLVEGLRDVVEEPYIRDNNNQALADSTTRAMVYLVDSVKGI